MRTHARVVLVASLAVGLMVPSGVAAATTAACPESIPSAGFSDVDPNGIHSANINCVAWWEITTGSGFGTYQPLPDVRRDQMATFIARLVESIGGDLPRFGSSDFSDVEFDNPHRDNIQRLADVGLVQGTGNGRFSPTATVSRAQMATFLVRAAEFARNEALPAGRDFFDDDNGNTHEANINKGAEAGFSQGVGNRQYNPLGAVRRDQMATFLAAALNRGVTLGDSFVPVQEITVDQVGDELTDRFRLRSAAEYRVRYTYSDDCFYGSFLDPEDDDYRSHSLSDDTGPASGERTVIDVEAATYRIQTFTGPDCHWQLTLSKVR